MAYTVLARRYRSTGFDDVVGQGAVAMTLKRAIEHDRVAHAYLFVGSRGVGKTSMARLFARELNAPGDRDGDPQVADAIMAGRGGDVVEIDAASNNRVEEARDIIANCALRPMRGPYKVYIIDEAHMLSTAAFNALLKTMEEPPEHVKFVLCTTEPHKILPTIQSRCQRFDFKNISSRAIGERIQWVLEQEGVTAELGLVAAVARMADGSMRDALSLLDRVLAAADTSITVPLSLLEDLLGLAPREAIAALLGAIADHDPGDALRCADALLDRGIGVDQLLDALVGELRDLLALGACGADTDLVDLGDEQRASAAELAARFDPAQVVHMIALCEQGGRLSKSALRPRALFEALVAQMAMADRLAGVAGGLRGGTRATEQVRAEGAPAKKG